MSTAPIINPTDELLSLAEAARELGVSRNTAYIWAASGRLPARDAAGRFVVRRQDLNAFRKERVAHGRNPSSGQFSTAVSKLVARIAKECSPLDA
jgi:excisionase family DNA binding protein